jgi:hypothetical protein
MTEYVSIHNAFEIELRSFRGKVKFWLYPDESSFYNTEGCTPENIYCSSILKNCGVSNYLGKDVEFIVSIYYSLAQYVAIRIPSLFLVVCIYCPTCGNKDFILFFAIL